MATHDYVIANQNGANFRSDLNNVLQAIISNNSSATEPSTTSAYMWWADTANDKLKMRNGADSAWIDVMQISTGNPLFTGDLNLGDGDKINFGDSNDLQIYHDGSHSYITDSGTGDLRISATNAYIGNDTNTYTYLYASPTSVALKSLNSTKLATTSTGVDVTGRITTDAITEDTSGKVGIGVTNPQRKLQVTGASGGNGEVLIATNGAFSGTDTATLGLRVYQNANENHNAQCEVEAVGTNDYSAALTFKVASGGTDNNPATERMRIDSSGNLLVGSTALPSSFDDYYNAEIKASEAGLMLNSTNTSAGKYSRLGFLVNGYSGNEGLIRYNNNDYHMSFWTDANDRMRIDSSGRMILGGVSSATPYDTGLFEIENDGTQYAQLIYNPSTGTQGCIRFHNPNGTVGAIYTNGSSTTYATSSDYRLKENVVDMDNAIDRVKALQPKRFNFIADEDDTTVDGFLAHEVQDIVPEAIGGEKDATKEEEYEVSPALGEIYTPAIEEITDEDGNVTQEAVAEAIISSDVEQPETLEDGQQWRETTPAEMGTRTVPDYQSIDQSKLVPLLTGALQEAIAKIESLEARIEALEA